MTNTSDKNTVNDLYNATLC